MKVRNAKISVELDAKDGMDNITSQVQVAIDKSGLKNGIVTVFVVGSTGAVSTIEFEPGLLKDVPRALEKIAPSDMNYEHHKTWGCDNGSSHVKSTLLGPGITVPFIAGKLTLGTWQQIVAINFDTKSRSREVVIQILGE